MKTDQNGGSNNREEVLRKGPWMPEEDEILVEYVRQYGARDWNSIGAKGLLPRTGKSCRLRWVNKLKPDLKSGCKFSPEEEKLVMEMQSKLGNKWAKIASYLPGRTDNDVKNFWSTRQKRMMRALQSPKVLSGTADVATIDHHIPDMTKTNYLTDFSVYHHMNSSAKPSMMQNNAFGSPYTFADDADPFRDQTMEIRKVRQKTQPFPNEIDDALMVKLQDLVAGDSLFLDTSQFIQQQQQPGAIVATDDSSEGSTMSSTLNNNNNNRNNCRPHAKHVRQGTSIKREMTNNNLEPIQSIEYQQNRDSIENHQLQLSLTQDTTCDFEVDLYIDANDSNILDFLLQPEEDSISSEQNSSTFSSHDHQHNPNDNTSNNQWEKLPPLCLDDIQISECAIKEEVDSCTPDSVLQVAGFPADVFDSLEPLSPAASVWWDSEWA